MIDRYQCCAGSNLSRLAGVSKAGARRRNPERSEGPLEKHGGASRDRTDDLIVANDALSQLSYSPTRVYFNRQLATLLICGF